MKTLSELKKDYQEVKKQLKETEEKAENTRQEAYKLADEGIAKRTERHLIYEKSNQLYAQVEFLKEVILLINNNEAIATQAEILPQVLDVINQFAGKKVGEKTKEKIHLQLKEMIKDHHIYFTSKEIVIDRIRLNLKKYDATILDDNNILIATNYDDYINYEAKLYIEDIEMFIYDRKIMLDELKKDYEALRKKVSDYNSKFAHIEGIKDAHIHSDNLY